MTTDAEVTASERESYRATIVALDAELARQKALNWRMLEKRTRDVVRIARLRSRLARALRAWGWWCHGTIYNERGGVWSRTVTPNPRRTP